MSSHARDQDDMPTQHTLKPLIVRALRECGARAHRRRFLARAKQLGAFSRAQLEKPTHSLGKRRQYPSELDYRLSWALNGLREDGTVVKVGDGYWRLAGN
jgi:hypothetical protein